MKAENIFTAVLFFSVIIFFLVIAVNMIMFVEYEKHPDYDNSEIFAQGFVQKSTDCYGITTAKVGNRVVNVNITVPTADGSYESVKLSNLCTDREFTIYRKNFFVGDAYTIK